MFCRLFMGYSILICSHRVYLNTNLGVFCFNTGIFYLLISRCAPTCLNNKLNKCYGFTVSNFLYYLTQFYLPLLDFSIIFPFKPSVPLM